MPQGCRHYPLILDFSAPGGIRPPTLNKLDFDLSARKYLDGDSVVHQWCAVGRFQYFLLGVSVQFCRTVDALEAVKRAERRGHRVVLAYECHA